MAKQELSSTLEELKGVTLCCLLCEGLRLIWSALLHGPILGKGFSRSPKFVAWPAVDDLVCYSAQMKEDASSCSNLLLQALVADNECALFIR
ncbi:hypothetical protein ACFX2I_021940 [Malus domestica]